MQNFKERWEITKNWQLLFPFLGLFGLFFSSYRLVDKLFTSQALYIKLPLTLIIGFLLLIPFTRKLLINLWFRNKYKTNHKPEEDIIDAEIIEEEKNKDEL